MKDTYIYNKVKGTVSHALTAALVASLPLLWACEDLTTPENNIPTVTTGDVTDVTARTATINIVGDATDYDYVELSTSQTFADEGTVRQDRLGSQWTATGLRPGTTYYYRQCATDGLTTVNGPTRQFTTDPLVNIASIRLAPWNSRAATEQLPGGTVGVFFSNVATSRDYTGLTNYLPALDTPSGEWQMPRDIVPPEEAHRFYAYAPYSRTVADKTLIPVTTLAENTDYLSGRSGDVTPARCNADIEMHHALARVVLQVSRHAESNAGYTIGEYGFYSLQQRIPISGELDLVRDSIVNRRMGEGLTRRINAFQPTDTPTALELFVIPFSFADGELTLGLFTGNSYTNGRWIELPAADWQAGYQYEYPVTVRQNKLELGDVVITPWTDGGGTDIIINN